MAASTERTGTVWRKPHRRRFERIYSLVELGKGRAVTPERRQYPGPEGRRFA